MYKYQLLYVYVNNYQAGGDMWYMVFDHCMLVLICGVFVLLCYLAIRQTYTTGPFYAILPLPVLLSYYWRYCNQRFKLTARVSYHHNYILYDLFITIFITIFYYYIIYL